MSHYIESWCHVHGDLLLDSDAAVSCPECETNREQSVQAMYRALRGVLAGQSADSFANVLDPEQYDIVEAVALRLAPSTQEES